MKKKIFKIFKDNRRIILLVSVIALSVLVLAFSLILASGGGAVDDKAAISKKIENATESSRNSYVIDYLYDWGIKNIDLVKVSWAEGVFASHYNYDGGLPPIFEHAKLTARNFLDNYYDYIDLDDETAVTDAVITCYVDAIGDPYSIYRVPEEVDDYNTDMSGKFGGIGAVIEYDHQNQTLCISSVYIDSPAEKSGLLPGDYIHAVEGKTVEELGYLNVIDHVRGKIGTTLKLTVKRGDTLLDFTLTRAAVEEKTVAYSLSEEKLGYIQIKGFKSNTFVQFVEAIDYMEANGALGIIFDLRGNPGGYLSSVRDMVSYLIPSGTTIVSYERKGELPRVLKSINDHHPISGNVNDHRINIPVTVICDGYTASAAEIFTSAIRDYRDMGIMDAKIIGQTTYKKGIMQDTYVRKLDGSSVTMTVAYYNPPCGVNYHGIGIIPDIEIQNTITEDLQLDKAIEELKNLIYANNN